jgi:hypothetical protein
MKNLVFVTMLAAGASLSTGCIISSDDGPSPCDDRELEGGACLEIVVDCPGGATGFTTSGTGATENVSCATGFVAILVNPGTYTIDVTPTAPGVEFLSDSRTVTVNDFDVVSVGFVNWSPLGFMGLTWTIQGAQPSAANCSAIGGDGGVSTIATLAGTASAEEDLFDCEDGQGVTAGHELGDYVVAIALLNADELAVADAADQNVSLTVESEFYDLGNFNFTPDP